MCQSYRLKGRQKKETWTDYFVYASEVSANTYAVVYE